MPSDLEELLGVSATPSDSGMATRCAWCGRYYLGERWVAVGSAPSFGDHAGVTHGICDDCVAELRAVGMSV